MAGKEFITQKILRSWKLAILDWFRSALDSGAKSVVIYYDYLEEMFKPLFVFPEQSIPIVVRRSFSFPEQLPVAVLQDADDLDVVLISISNFFDKGIEN